MSATVTVKDTKQKFAGKVLQFSLAGKTRNYILGAMRYGYLRQFTKSEPFDASTGEGEQRAVIESHAKQIKKAMAGGAYAPTVFVLGTRQKHRLDVDLKDGFATLVVSSETPLPVLDGGNRIWALDKLREEGPAMERIIDNLHIPYLLYLDGNTREDFVALQAGKPVSRDHMLSVRITTGLLDEKHAPYFRLAKDVAHILHTTMDSYCHNIIQFDSTGEKVPISLNSLCTKGASDLAFSLYGGAKIAHNYGKDAAWLANCILTAYRAIKQDDDAVELLSKGKILCPAPGGTKAGTSLLIGIGNMLAARLSLKQLDEPEDADIQLLIDCAYANLNIDASGNTSADGKRKLLKKFAIDFFSDLIAAPDAEADEAEDDEEGLDVPSKAIGAHEGIPVALIRLLSPSTFNVSKLPSERKGRGRKAGVVSAALTEEVDDETENEVEVPVDSTIVEDPVDAAAFAEDDAKAKDAGRKPEDEPAEETEAPNDDVESDQNSDEDHGTSQTSWDNDESSEVEDDSDEDAAPWDEDAPL